jgi:hypothetical protein
MNLFENFDDQTEVNFVFYGLAPVEGSGPGSSELALIEEDGLLVPNDFDSFSSSSSEYTLETSGNSAASVADLVALYRTDLSAKGWTEQVDASEVGDSEANLTFENPESLLTIKISDSGDESELSLKLKMVAAAKAKGILPPAGQTRLYLGSMNEKDVTIDINGQTLTVAPTSPDAGPEDTMFVDLPSGSHPYTLAIPGAAEQSETLEMGPDEVWMLVIAPDGAFPLQIY